MVYLLIEALHRTIFFVPSADENEFLVREYFEIVRSVYPDNRPDLEKRFFAPLEPNPMELMSMEANPMEPSLSAPPKK